MISNIKYYGFECCIRLGFCDIKCSLNMFYVVPSFKKYWQQQIIWPQSQLTKLKTTENVKKILFDNCSPKFIWQ